MIVIGTKIHLISRAIRQANIKSFTDKINTKIKDLKKFHSALKNFSLVESKINDQDSYIISPTVLNGAFLKNNNAKVNEDLV
jgi:hypothetical protein